MVRRDVDLPMSKKLSIWFRRNERKFWGILLVLVICTFGVSFTMSQVIMSWGRKVRLQCAGTNYKLDDLKKLEIVFHKIGRIDPSLDFQRLLLINSEDKYLVDIMAPLLSAFEEAKQLDIVVPSDLVLKTAKDCYLNSKAAEKFRELPQAEKPTDRSAQKKIIDDFKKNIEWSDNVYREWTENNNFTVPDFEYYLGKVLQLKGLFNFYIEQNLIGKKDIYDLFVKLKRKISLKFTRLEADKYLDKVNKKIEEKDLKDYYNKNLDKFIRNNQIQFSYLKYPVSHFEKDVTITEEELLKQYDIYKTTKYLKNPLGVEPTVDYPLTPKEQNKLDAETYIPFAKVRDELKKTLTESKKKQLARSFGQRILKQLAETTGTPKKPKPDDKKKTTTVEELAKQYSFLKPGTTPFFTKDSAEKKLGGLYSEYSVKTWFDSLLKENKKLSAPPYPIPTREGDEYFIITSIKGEKTKQLTFEEAKDKVARAIKMKSASKIAEKKAQDLMLKIREGKGLTSGDTKDIKIYTTDMIESNDSGKGKITIGKDNIPKEIEQKVFANFFYQMDVNDKTTPSPLKYEDKENGDITWYVFAIDKTEPPDSREFTETIEKSFRSRLEQTNFYQRIRSGWPAYLKALTARYSKIPGR